MPPLLYSIYYVAIQMARSGRMRAKQFNVIVGCQNLDAAFMALSTEWSNVIAAARHHDERSESRCGVHSTFDRVVKRY